MAWLSHHPFVAAAPSFLPRLLSLVVVVLLVFWTETTESFSSSSLRRKRTIVTAPGGRHCTTSTTTTSTTTSRGFRLASTLSDRETAAPTTAAEPDAPSTASSTAPASIASPSSSSASNVFNNNKGRRAGVLVPPKSLEEIFSRRGETEELYSQSVQKTYGYVVHLSMRYEIYTSAKKKLEARS
jgi:hypothetical protein